jgi:hypothetical protein
MTRWTYVSSSNASSSFITLGWPGKRAHERMRGRGMGRWGAGARRGATVRTQQRRGPMRRLVGGRSPIQRHAGPMQRHASSDGPHAAPCGRPGLAPHLPGDT